MIDTLTTEQYDALILLAREGAFYRARFDHCGPGFHVDCTVCAKIGLIEHLLLSPISGVDAFPAGAGHPSYVGPNGDGEE